MADGSPRVEGVDYANAHPDPVQLFALGRRFACRYGGPGGSWKHLTPAEAQALSAAGISIVANAEGSADGLVGGWSTGFSWASSAEAHFRRCGMPAGRPIYFSVDFDVQSRQWAAVASALSGAAEALGGVHRVGVYGGRRAIEWARRDGVAAWFWQTFAWSGGIWAPGNNIEQYRNGVSLAGSADLDLDRALTSDYGQWTTNGDDMSDAYNLLDQLIRTQGNNTYTPSGADGARYGSLSNAQAVASIQKAEKDARLAADTAMVIKAMVDRLSIPAPVPVDIDALVAALKPELEAAAERAVRTVLGKLDEAQG